MLAVSRRAARRALYSLGGEGRLGYGVTLAASTVSRQKCPKTRQNETQKDVICPRAGCGFYSWWKKDMLDTRSYYFLR
jgi:hypothetical protein